MGIAVQDYRALVAEMEHLRAIIGRLHHRFPDLPVNAVEDAVEHRYHEYDRAHRRQLILKLVERAAVTDLAKAGQN